MQAFCRSLRGVKIHFTGSKIIHSQSSKGYLVNGVLREPNVSIVETPMLSSFLRQPNDQGTSCSSATSGNDDVDIFSTLRNGAAAENAAAVMQEKGFSKPRRSRHRLTP